MFLCAQLSGSMSRTTTLFPVVSSSIQLFYDVFGIALIGGHLGSVEARKRCSMRTERAAYSTHRALVSCVEAAGQQIAESFWNVVGCDEVVRIGEGLELLENSRRADSHTVKLFVARMVAVL